MRDVGALRFALSVDRASWRMGSARTQVKFSPCAQHVACKLELAPRAPGSIALHLADRRRVCAPHRMMRGARKPPAACARGRCARSTRLRHPSQRSDPSVAGHRERSLSRISKRVRRAELSDQEYFSFSGVGAVVCTVNGEQRMSTAFLVGAFDIGVTVAHTFVDNGKWVQPENCVYTTTDSLGQIRERIPVAYIKAQWESEAGAYRSACQRLRSDSPGRTVALRTAHDAAR